MSIENPNNWEDYHEDDTKSHSLDNSQIISHSVSSPDKNLPPTPEQNPEENPKHQKIEINPNEINPENVEDVIQKKVSELNKQPEKLDIKNQLLNLVGNAEIILNSKETSPQEKAELLKDYADKIAQLLNLPATKIYLPELIKDNKNLDLLLNKVPEIQNQEKNKPQVIPQAAELIKKEETKGKKSSFQQMGGWKTVGEITGFSLMMLLILIFLGEVKLVEKTTGTNLEGKKK